MAIPDWLWPDDGRNTGVQGEPLQAADVERATGVFEILSDAIRLEILTTLHEQSGPMSYTELRESTSVDDKGKFNYHLRQLEHFVRRRDGAYTLTRRGDELVRGVLSDERIVHSE